MSTLGKLDNFLHSELFPIVKECEIIKEEVLDKFERYILYYRGNILRVEKTIVGRYEKSTDVIFSVNVNLDTISESGNLNIHEEMVFCDNQLFIYMLQLFIEVRNSFKFQERNKKNSDILNLLRNWITR